MKRTVFLLIVILSSFWLANRFIHGDFEAGAMDFRVFWASVRGDPYAATTMPFGNPPTSLVFFKPLAFAPYTEGLYFWVGVSLSVYLFAAARATNWGVALLTVPSGAILSTVALGQVSLLLGGLIIGAFTVAPFWGGVMLAIAGAVKPQLVLLAPLALIVRRDWTMLKGIVAGGATLLAMTLPEVGLWQRWIDAMPHFTSVAYDTAARLITPYAITRSWLIFGLAAITSAASIITSAKKLDGPYLAALIVAASLFASPYGHLHDLAPVMPACVLLMLKGPRIAAVSAGVVYIGLVKFSMPVLLGGMLWLAAQPLIIKTRDRLPLSNQYRA